MTREEAKSFIFSDCNPYVVKHIHSETDSKYLHRRSVLDFIDKIYDDFEKQIGSKKNTKTCKWRLLPDNFADIWYGECGARFMFNEGNLKENDFNFCHKCGKKIEEKEDV